MPPAPPPTGHAALALLNDGRVDEAVALLDARAAAGDAEAALMQGLWHVEGRALPRDLVAARARFDVAQVRGHAGAARILSGMIAAGQGGPADWPGALVLLDRWADRDPLARRQRALIDAMGLDTAGDPRALPDPVVLSAAPHVARLPGLLSAAECAFLIDLATPRLRPAAIFHEGQGRFVQDPLRRSDAAGFPLIAEWPAVHALNRRFAAASATQVAQGEPLQLLRYRPGDEYRPHLDAFAGIGNQRRVTVLARLNDGYRGGETHFPDLGLTIAGRRGDGLLFHNALPDDRPDPRTRHAGLPVTTGEKLLASRWIRARPPGDEGFGRHEMAGRG